MAEAPKPPQPAPQLQVQVESDPGTRQGTYSNMALFTHTAEEFILDFLFVVAQPRYGRLNARVLMSPGHAKRVVAALSDSVAKYEQKFGPIPELPGPPNPGIVH